MPAQVIFAYANDDDNSLQFLEEEIKEVYECVIGINKKSPGLVNPVQLQNVDKDRLFTEFDARKDELTVFHFSGHSGLFNLMFSKEDLVDGRGIARLLEFAPNLELVFLNGCANKDLIEWFHDAGVKRVIATKRKVFDEMASKFSQYFYKFLTDDNIGEAFNQAKSYLLTAKAECADTKYRHISTEDLTGDEDEFPYAIYYKPLYKKSGALNKNMSDYENWDKWRFSDYKFVPTEYKPCLNLLTTIGATGFIMVEYLQKIKSNDKEEIAEFRQLHDEYKKFKKTLDINFSGMLSGKITQLLPRPLGIIMQQMVSTSIEISQGKLRKYDELLNYQFRFYDVLLKISCYTMVSDLFEVIQKRKSNKKQIYFDRKTQADIVRMLSLAEADLISFNYRDLIQRIRGIILKNEETPFINEYFSVANAETDDNLESAYRNIVKMRSQYKTGALKGEVIGFAESMENELCNVFKEVFYILRYNLLVIRNIEAIKTRWIKKCFLHKYMVLRGNMSAFHFDDHAVSDYTDSYSVILVKGLHSIIDYLSLCPFVIDKCVLTDDSSSELFYFSHCKDDILVYEEVQDQSQTIEIKLEEDVDKDLDDDDMPVITTVVSIPYVNEAVARDNNLNKEKMTTQLQMIYQQFHILKTEFENLSFVNN